MVLLFELRGRATREDGGGAASLGLLTSWSPGPRATGRLPRPAPVPRWQAGGMCRSIKTLRPPAIPDDATEEEIRAAALQYVRKVSGFRAPAAHNREVFDRAVDAVAEATAELLAGLEVRGARAS